MTLEDIIEARDTIEREWRSVSKRIKALSDSEPRGALGLTNDKVKASQSWQDMRAEQANLFARLRGLNGIIAKMR